MQNERDHCRLNVERLPVDTVWLYSSQTGQPCLSLDGRTLPSGWKSPKKTRMVISLLFSSLQPFFFYFFFLFFWLFFFIFFALSHSTVFFFFFNGAPSSPKTSQFYSFVFFFFSLLLREKHLRHAIRRRLWFITGSTWMMGKREFRPTISLQFLFFNFYWILDQGTWPPPILAILVIKIRRKRILTASFLIKWRLEEIGENLTIARQTHSIAGIVFLSRRSKKEQKFIVYIMFVFLVFFFFSLGLAAPAFVSARASDRAASVLCKWGSLTIRATTDGPREKKMLIIFWRVGDMRGIMQ